MQITTDAALLEAAQFRQKVADSLANGVTHYLLG